MNLFGIWQMQKIEQVYAVPNPTLPAPETFNFLFKNAIYCKKRENLHAALVSQVPQKSKISPPAGQTKCRSLQIKKSNIKHWDQNSIQNLFQP